MIQDLVVSGGYSWMLHFASLETRKLVTYTNYSAAYYNSYFNNA